LIFRIKKYSGFKRGDMSKKGRLCSTLSSRRSCSREGDDLLHGLMKCVLDDLAEDVCNRLLNLFVDAHLYICLGVYIDVALGLVSVVIEDAAVTLVFDVEHVFGADKIAVTGFNWVATFV